MAMRERSRSKGIGITIFIILLLTPIYWLLNMSFKTNREILSGLTLWPQNFTFDNYVVIFTDSSWYSGYINSISLPLVSNCSQAIFSA